MTMQVATLIAIVAGILCAILACIVGTFVHADDWEIARQAKREVEDEIK